jgi:hypothetical protein
MGFINRLPAILAKSVIMICSWSFILLYDHNQISFQEFFQKLVSATPQEILQTATPFSGGRAGGDTRNLI